MSTGTEYIVQLLKKHHLRITDCRQETLSVFADNSYALSQPDLERSLGENYDRVTIYRTLTSFLEKGLIHRVLDDTGIAKYALCREECDTHSHNDEHIHFKCDRCGNTSCLEDLPFPHFKAPEGYLFTETSVLISGICRNCR